jgi:DNA repair protein RecN (Recombination protein N)
LLLELRIRNIAIIEKLDIDLSPGLNILTGETGAGKSIIIDALGLLLGDKADRTLVRSGAERAEIEGVIALDEYTASLLAPFLEEYGLLNEEDENLILFRGLNANGRSLGRVNGRAVNIRLLRHIGELLVDVHGQSEHLSLFRVRNHLDLLDRYVGVMELRQALSDGVAELRELRERIAQLRQERSLQAERREMLRFRLEEITAAELRLGEEEDLRQERHRLQNATRLMDAVKHLHRILNGAEDRSARSVSGVLDLLGMGVRELETLVEMDPSMALQLELLNSVSVQVEELAHTLRTYREQLDLDPHRLTEVEDRLVLIRELERKYGPNIEAVLASAEQAREELSEFTHSEERLQELLEEETRLLEELGRLAGRISTVRQASAGQLSEAIESTMADLNMRGTTFTAKIERHQDPDGLLVDGDVPFPSGRYAFDASGIDQVEFLISPNPGEDLRPLARIASGGESSRLFLAIKSILFEADATPILVFDEVDAGIGGRSGYVVGEKLWDLSRHHQVICITHLPQIAAYADAHFSIGKKVRSGRTETFVTHLEGEELLKELSEMLGGPAVSKAHRESARQILEQAQQHKAGQEA